MTIGEAQDRLREHWGGALFVEPQPSVVTISNQSRAAREASIPHLARAKVYEAPTMQIALTSALRGEGIIR